MCVACSRCTAAEACLRCTGCGGVPTTALGCGRVPTSRGMQAHHQQHQHHHQQHQYQHHHHQQHQQHQQRQLTWRRRLWRPRPACPSAVDGGRKRLRRGHSHGPRCSRPARRPTRRPARRPVHVPVGVAVSSMAVSARASAMGAAQRPWQLAPPPARRSVRRPARRPTRQAPHPGLLGIARPHTRRRWPRPPAASSDAWHPTKPTRAPHHRRRAIPCRCFEPTCRPHQGRRRRVGGPRLRRASCRGWCLGIRWPLRRRPRAGLSTKRTRTRSRTKGMRSMRWRR